MRAAPKVGPLLALGLTLPRSEPSATTTYATKASLAFAAQKEAFSAATLLSPAELAVDIIKAIWPLPLPSEPEHTALTEWSRAAPGPQQDPYLHCTRHGPPDHGAGRFSQTNHSVPSNNAALPPLQCRRAQWATEGDRHLRIAAYLAQGKPDCPLSEEERSQVAHLALSALLSGSNDLLAVSRSQPFRLGLMKALAAMSNDPDLALFLHMEQGVPAGVFSELPSSHQ